MKKILVFATAMVAAACSQGPKLYSEKDFKGEVDGVKIGLYTLKNGQITAQITNFGGRVVALWAPDRIGNLTDIVLGHDNLEAYIHPDGGERFLGATVGPVANRIGNAYYVLDGKEFHTDENDNFVNTLHGGYKGLDMCAWDVTAVTDSTLSLSYKWKDGEGGFPGNTVYTIDYQLLADSSLKVVMGAESDKDTPVNMAHHPFFNLRGEGEGTVEEYEMQIAASSYIPIDRLSIPTGEIQPVDGTPFDFRQGRAIGQLINTLDGQLYNAKGYDHNWCLDRKTTDSLEFAARVTDHLTGRYVEVLTDQPGLQFYSGNFFNGRENGKNGKPYEFRCALALETQKWPDAVNHENFPSVVLKAGEKYSHTAVYRFGVEARWEPAGDRIMTGWAYAVTPENAHREYPRPQMVRSAGWESLNGLWDYAVVPESLESQTTAGPETAFPRFADGQILVPFCLESALSGVGKKLGADDVLWYRKKFMKPSGEKVLLHFGTVDWEARVFVNGTEVGSHTGGYSAFSFDITSSLQEGENELWVRVKDGTDNGEQPRGKQVRRPRGIWYTAVSGIWQSVWLENVPASYIRSYYASADYDANLVEVSADVCGWPEGAVVQANLYEGGVGYSTEDAYGALVGNAEIVVGDTCFISVDKPVHWTPENPYLYALELVLQDADGRTLDSVRGYTAIRKSSMVADASGIKRLGLNNEPYFQFGPLDQGWWPDGLYTAPCDEALRYDIEKTKEFGFNMIRKHVKVEPDRWYWWCDRLGILVWQDMPSLTGNLNNGNSPQWGQWGFDTGYDYPLTETAKENYLKEWPEIIQQHKGFPCIVTWVPFNEGWSQFDTEKVAELTKSLDPTRLVNPASGGNYRHCGDIMDIHNYPGPLMKFTSGGEMIDVLGEYGGLGLPVEGHLWQPDRNWGYIGYKTADEVIAKYEEFAATLAGMVPEGVSGAVYTQTTDCEIEVNGLMTYDRIPKLDIPRLHKANRSVIDALKK